MTCIFWGFLLYYAFYNIMFFFFSFLHRSLPADAFVILSAQIRYGNRFSLTAILIDYARRWLHEVRVMWPASLLRRLRGQHIGTQLDEAVQWTPAVAVFQLELLETAVLVVAEEDLEIGNEDVNLHELRLLY